MPAGSGPQPNQTQPGALAADTAEHVICTIPASNWNNPNGTGNIITFDAVVAGLGAGTVTFRVRQGTTIAGTQVGVNVPVTVAAASNNPTGIEFQDSSAFGNASPAGGGQYVLTYQQSVASIASIANALLTLETCAPVA